MCTRSIFCYMSYRLFSREDLDWNYGRRNCSESYSEELMFVRHGSWIWWIGLWRLIPTYPDSDVKLYWDSNLYSELLFGVFSQCVERTELSVLVPAAVLRGEVSNALVTTNRAKQESEWNGVQPNLNFKRRLHLKRREACCSRSPLVRCNTDRSEDRSQPVFWCYQCVPQASVPDTRIVPILIYSNQNIVTHIALWNGKQLWATIKQGRANGIQDRTSHL